MTRRIMMFVVFASLATGVFAEDEGPTGRFDAVAEVTSSQGTRTLSVTIEVLRPMTPQETAGLREILEKGGQQALANAIRGSMRGQLLLGGVVFPLDLVVAEQKDDDWRFVVVTNRNFHWDEIQLEEPSVEYPFAVAVFDVPDMGRGSGEVAPKAALSVDADGRVAVDRFEGEQGRLKDVKRR